MRLLLITWACDLDDVSEPGVSARWVKELAKDHEVVLFAVSKPERLGCVKEQFPELLVYEWCDIRVPAWLERFRAIVKPGYLPYFFRARRFLRQLLEETQFDVIHHLSPFAWRYPSPAAGLCVPLVRGPVAGGIQTPSGLAGGLLSRLHPFALLRRSDQFRIRLDRQLRFSYRNTSHLLMAAPYMREFLEPLQLGNFSIEIELGIESEIYAEPDPGVRAKKEGDKFHLLYVGRVVTTKGLQFAIKALAQARCRSNADLTVVGNGEDLKACKKEVERLGLQEQVNFRGWCEKSVVENCYRQADTFIFPSYREPTGGVLLEAMAHGLPLIVCAHGGPDYMVDSSCGIKVPPSTETEYVRRLAEAIDLLASDVDLRKSMSKNAWARAKNEFEWPPKRRRMHELYKQLSRQSLRKENLQLGSECEPTDRKEHGSHHYSRPQ